MRCSPGDLCIVISGVPTSNIGRMVTVREPRLVQGLLVWTFSGSLVSSDGRRHLDGVADDCLQPIRPPRSPDAITTPAQDFAHG